MWAWISRMVATVWSVVRSQWKRIYPKVKTAMANAVSWAKAAITRYATKAYQFLKRNKWNVGWAVWEFLKYIFGW